MPTNQTTPDHIGDANKMVSTMPERISFFASRVATTLFEAGHIDQRNHAKVSKVVALMVNDELNQSLLAQSVLREALISAHKLFGQMCPETFKSKKAQEAAEQIWGVLDKAVASLSTTTPPTDRIVVTREIVERWDSLEQRLAAMSEAAKSLASAAGHIGYVSSGDPHVIKKAEKAIELFEQVLSEIEAHK